MDIRPLISGQVQPLIDQLYLGSYLQSDAWAEFQKAYGRGVTRLGAYDGERLLGAVSIFHHELLMNKTYGYIPHGPITADREVYSALVEAALSTSRTSSAMYLKIDQPSHSFSTEPTLPDDFVPGTALQPRHTQVLDSLQADDALLAQMHQKSRYNLRLAQKKGVTIRWSTQDEDFSAFMKLQHNTYTRHNIRPHPDHYYQLMFATLRAQNMVELGIAEYQGEIVAVNEIIWCGSTATYIHGASSDLHKEVMAPYFLQWETMQRARQKNMRAYDLRGISPADQPDHKLAGVTRFKLGLGGKTVIYPEAMNAILQPTWYWAYRLAKRARGGQGD